MTDKSLQDIELQLLLEGVYQHYGYDFRDYSPSSLLRRLSHSMRALNLHSISALQDLVLHDPLAMHRLFLDLSVNATSLFRDPPFFLALKLHVLPILRTYPFIRIWVAGCSTGEEAYSLAILLTEERLYHRCQIYATDINPALLSRAQAATFPSSSLQLYAANYARAGGTRHLSDYLSPLPSHNHPLDTSQLPAPQEAGLPLGTSQLKTMPSTLSAEKGKGQNHALDPERREGEGSDLTLHPSLKKNILFAQHNLVTDGPFNEFNLILCRNVLIYFNKSLQNRVHHLLHQSLSPLGILALGKNETTRFTSHHHSYKQLHPPASLYRKIE